MYNAYGQSISLERINNQIQELEKLKNQIQQPVPITQNFQIAPTNNTLKYANSISDVEKEYVIGDTPYFSKDMSILWIKNSKGNGLNTTTDKPNESTKSTGFSQIRNSKK